MRNGFCFLRVGVKNTPLLQAAAFVMFLFKMFAFKMFAKEGTADAKIA